MIAKPFQAVQFSETPICTCDSKSSQIAETTDISPMQLTMEVCNFVDDSIVNGSFQDSDGDGWSNNSFGWSFSGENTSSDSATNGELITDEFVVGHRFAYQLEIDISENIGEPLLVYFGSTKVLEVLNTGQFQVSGICNEPVLFAGKLKIVSTVGNSATIESVVMYPIESNIGIAVQGVNGDILHFRTLKDDIDDATTDIFRRDRDVVTASGNWNWVANIYPGGGLGLGEGCYSFGFASQCSNTNGQLGVFDPEMNFPVPLVGSDYPLTSSTFPWKCTGKLQIYREPQTGYMIQKGNNASAISVTEYNFIPLPLATYEVEMEIANVNAATGISIALGGVNSSVYNSNGVHSFDITPTNTNELELKFLNTVPGDGIHLLYFRIKIKESTDLDKITSDISTNIFDLKESHPCSLVVAGANNEDAFGLRFESSFFTPRFRMRGTLRASDFNTEIDTHINGIGQKIIDYFEERKSFALRLQGVPDYLIDFLAILRGFSKVYVDSSEYVASEDLEVRPNRFCDGGRVEMILEPIRQELTSTNRKGLSAVSDINNYLVREFDEQEFIIFTDGEQIELRG